MKYVNQPISVLRSVVLSALLAGGTSHAQTAGLETLREPLTFRDSGLYANLGSVHGRAQEDDGLTNLLTADRAAHPDTPWDFYIMQYNAQAPDTNSAARVKALAENGKKVILRVLFGKVEHTIDLGLAKQRLDDLFVHTRPEWLYAITLDEENVYWNGNTPRLIELYEYAKEQWPGLPVYQWWSPMIAPEVGAESGWVALPADGWVMDLYGRPAEEFEKKMLKFLETGKPLIHIAWASPTWMFHDKEGCTKDDWWEKAGRPVFDDQMRICREYNVPVAYFCTQQAEFQDGKRIAKIRWGWHAVCPITRRWFHELEVIAANLDYLPQETIGFRAPTPALLSWAHSAPTTTVQLEFTETDARRLTWRTWFSIATPTSEGTHDLPRPYDNPYVRVSYTLDKAAVDLRDGFNVASYARVPVVFRIEPRQGLTDLQITARVRVIDVLGGNAGLAFSRDGETWSDEVRADTATRRPQDLEADVSGGDEAGNTGPVFVRVNLASNAGPKSRIAARLHGLTVSGVLPPES